MKVGILVSASLLLVQCSSNNSQEVVHTVAPIPPSITVLKPVARRQVAPTGVVFDLDALHGLSIDQLKAKLGKPVKDLQSNFDGSQRECLFKKKGFLLDANYDVRSRIVDILILSDTSSILCYKQLLSLSNADTTSIRYKVEASQGPNTGSNVGVEITPREIEQLNI